MWESEPCIHCLSVICFLERPKDSAGKVWHVSVKDSFWMILMLYYHIILNQDNKKQFSTILYQSLLNMKLLRWKKKKCKLWALVYHSICIWRAFDPWSSRAQGSFTFSWHWARWLAGSTRRKQRAPPSACEPPCVGLALVWSQHKLCWSWPSRALPALESELSTGWTTTSSALLMCSQEAVNKICAYIRHPKLGFVRADVLL